jgi:hypothetical protein
MTGRSGLEGALERLAEGVRNAPRKTATLGQQSF